jgi:hypothetical protein
MVHRATTTRLQHSGRVTLATCVQEVTLNYNFKAKALQKVGIKSVDLQFVGNNLAVWDQVDIFDPEQAASNGRVYPLPATFTLQMYLHF